jgi:hypothetical protein
MHTKSESGDIEKKQKQIKEIVSNLKSHQNCSILFNYLLQKSLFSKKLASLVLGFNYAFS